MTFDTAKPILAVCLACTVWGLSGVYYDLLSHISPVEILAHRSFWAMIFFSGVLFYKGHFFKLIKDILIARELVLLSASAFMISANWFAFIFAIQNDQAIQASFGYYIFPLVAVLLGYLFRGERFSNIQLLAIIFAGFAVISLGFALKLLPLIALIIALTFGAYGLIKSFTKIGSIESVTIETILIAPMSVSFIIFSYFSNIQANYQIIKTDLFLLMMSGVITGGPLILFSFAAQKLTYATVGILQYINPTLQFLVAVFILIEPFNTWHAFSLIFIWIGIIIYSGESWRLESKR